MQFRGCAAAHHGNYPDTQRREFPSETAELQAMGANRTARVPVRHRTIIAEAIK